MWSPVLHFELLRTSRRRWHRRVIWIYAFWLAFLTALLFVVDLVGKSQPVKITPAFLADFGAMLVPELIAQQFIILMLVTPALATGSITDEKARGTLQEWLTTGLSSWEIVRDKMLAQVIQLGALTLVMLPMLASFGAFAGLDLWDMAWLELAFLGQVLVLTAISVLAATWCRQTTSAVLVVFTVVAGLSLVVSLFSPAWLAPWLWGGPGFIGTPLLHGALAWASAVVVCIGLAVWRFRPAYLRQLGAAGNAGLRRRKSLSRQPVGDKPLRWKECYLITTPFFLPISRGWCAAAVGAGTGVWCLALLLKQLPPDVDMADLFAMIVQLDVAGLFSVWTARESAHASFFLMSFGALVLFSVVSSEREQKTWEVLLTTPLDVRQILRGKIWGVIDLVWPCLVAYLVPAALCALLDSLVAFIWVVLWWTAMIIVMYFCAATGLYCSVVSVSSRRSLV
jgi:ABC-type transport system involved in multi-copper enzyme maturation permease subunit